MNTFIKRLIIISIFFLPFIYLTTSLFPFVFPKALFVEIISLTVGVCWLISKINENKNIKISHNIVFWSFLSYIFILLICSVNSVVPSLSFWGNFDRGTGVIFTLCIFVFSVVMGSVFKTREEWNELFTTFAFSGIFFTIGTFLSEMGVKFFSQLKINASNGFTIGNSSYAGFYLSSVFFVGLYLIFISKSNRQKVLGWATVIITLLNPIITGLVIRAPNESYRIIGLARATEYSIFLGIGIFIIYLLFRKITSLKWRNIFIGICVIFIIAGIAFVSFSKPNPAREFVKTHAGPNRIIFWDIAWSGLKEKPLLGWGSDTYHIVYMKHFNPIISTPGYDPEYWVDKSHSFYFDELVSNGILGFLSLMFLYCILLFGLARKAIKQLDKEGLVFMVIFVWLVSFLVQGIMLFQTVMGWFVLAIIIAFVSNFCFEKRLIIWKNELAEYKGFIYILLFVTYFIGLTFIVIKPYNISNKLNNLLIMSPKERLIAYQEIKDSYIGNTTDSSTVFLKFFTEMRKSLGHIKLTQDQRKGTIEEINQITTVLESGLQKENYKDMKLLMSTVGYYSILTALSKDDDQKKYYDKGMFYVNKMYEASPQFPADEMAKSVMNISLKYGENSLSM